jgi:hypothetical protein
MLSLALSRVGCLLALLLLPPLALCLCLLVLFLLCVLALASKDVYIDMRTHEWRILNEMAIQNESEPVRCRRTLVRYNRVFKQALMFKLLIPEIRKTSHERVQSMSWPNNEEYRKRDSNRNVAFQNHSTSHDYATSARHQTALCYKSIGDETSRQTRQTQVGTHGLALAENNMM